VSLFSVSLHSVNMDANIKIFGVLLAFLGFTVAVPNVVVILTDDQDLVLKSLEYLPKINSLLTNKGTIFANAV
jgi:hypothetical protein